MVSILRISRQPAVANMCPADTAVPLTIPKKARAANRRTRIVILPQLDQFFKLPRKEIKGQKIPSQGYATYTLKILLPAKRPRIGLEKTKPLRFG
jgi:hypothetical protein